MKRIRQEVLVMSVMSHGLKLCGRAMSTVHRSLPYSKEAIKARKPKYTSLYPTKSGLESPKLAEKFLRHAERVAWELGVVEELRAFEEAAAAFPNPPPIIAATLLERGNMITRDVEDWESAFLAHKEERRLAQAKEYPKELLDMWSVKGRVMEKSAPGKEGEGKGGSSAKKKDGGVAKEEDAAADEAAELARVSAAGQQDLVNFYESMPSVGGGESLGNDAASSLLKTPRTSSADTIGDTRSLDRAYQHRLVLVVKGGGGGVGGEKEGEWGVPSGPARPGEPLVQAAERVVRGMFGAEAHLDVWYPGVAPVGHRLVVYPPPVAQAKGCYGERHFYYRAELLGGRFRLPEAAPATPREGCPYTDFHWLTRDETEGYLPRPLFKYLHQVIGAGAGEEASRTAAWRKRLEGKKWGIGRGTAMRAARVAGGVAGYTRLRALATGEQCTLAAAPFAGDPRGKLAALGAQSDRYHDRRREQAGRAEVQRVALQDKPRVEAIRAALTAARLGGGGGSKSAQHQHQQHNRA